MLQVTLGLREHQNSACLATTQLICQLAGSLLAHTKFVNLSGSWQFRVLKRSTHPYVLICALPKSPGRWGWWAVPGLFLQRVSIACYMQSAVLAMTDSIWPSDRPSDRPSVTCWYHAKRLQLRSCGLHWRIADSPMTLVSWRLTLAQNSKGNIGARTPNERGVAQM